MIFQKLMQLPIQPRMTPHHLQELQDPDTDKVDDGDYPQPSISQWAIFQCMTDTHNQICTVAFITIVAA